jgi:hypothetical protein
MSVLPIVCRGLEFGVGNSRGEESSVLAPLKAARAAKWPGYAKPLLGLGKFTRIAYA